MSPNHTLLQELLDGSLTGDQAKLLADEMARNPETYQQAVEQLNIADLIEQTLSPTRSDSAFLSQVSASLDQADAGDYGDNSDGSSDPSPDPQTPRGGSETNDANSGIPNRTKALVGAVLAIGIGAAALVMNRFDKPEPLATPAAASSTTWVDIIAEADLELHKGDSDHAARRDAAYTLYLHGSRGKNVRCRILLRFDIGSLPDDYERIELRLSSPIADDLSPEPTLSVSPNNDDWSEQARELKAPKFGQALMRWRPVAGETSVLDVTKVVAQEKANDGKITFVIGGPNWPKPTLGFVFYSREFNQEALRPTLRVYTREKKNGE